MKSVELNGKTIDVSNVVPLRVRHWKELEAQGIRISDLSDPSVDLISRFVLYVLQQADGSVTEKDIDGLTLNELNALVVEMSTDGREVLDRPT